MDGYTIVACVVATIIVVVAFSAWGAKIEKQDVNKTGSQINASLICLIFGIFGVLYCYHRMDRNNIDELRREVNELRDALVHQTKGEIDGKKIIEIIQKELR